MARRLVLVTGATGRLGREVVGRLLRGGHDVRALVRGRRPRQALEAAEVHVVPGDYADGAALAAACEGVDAVVACAGKGLRRGPETHHDVDGAGTARLVDAARDAGVRRFVFVSWLGAGRGFDAAPFRAKEFAERHLFASGLAHVVLRAAPFHWVLLRMARQAFVRRRIFVIGDGTARSSPVSIGDIAHACVLAALEEAPSRVLEIGGPDAKSWDRWASEIARQVGRPGVPVTHVPVALVRAGAALARHLRPSAPEVADLAITTATDHLVADNRALLDAFPGLALTPMHELVREEFMMSVPDGLF